MLYLCFEWAIIFMISKYKTSDKGLFTFYKEQEDLDFLQQKVRQQNHKNKPTHPKNQINNSKKKKKKKIVKTQPAQLNCGRAQTVDGKEKFLKNIILNKNYLKSALLKQKVEKPSKQANSQKQEEFVLFHNDEQRVNKRSSVTTKQEIIFQKSKQQFRSIRKSENFKKQCSEQPLRRKQSRSLRKQKHGQVSKSIDRSSGQINSININLVQEQKTLPLNHKRQSILKASLHSSQYLKEFIKLKSNFYQKVFKQEPKKSEVKEARKYQFLEEELMKDKQKYNLKIKTEESVKAIKLPYVKQNRMSKALHNLMEIASHQDNTHTRHLIKKKKMIGHKEEGNFSSEHLNHSSLLIYRKNLDQFPSEIHLATIDFSQNENTFDNFAYKLTEEKKQALKKLGLKLKFSKL